MTKSSGGEKYTDPKLRDQLKENIQAGDKGGKSGQWSARKAQLLASEYKSHGGSYHGPKDSRAKHLDQWTREEWQTKDGDSNAIVNDNSQGSGGETHRYLPKKAWERMSDEEKEETDRVKVEGSKVGKQFVPNTEKAVEVRREVGRESGKEVGNNGIGDKHVETDADETADDGSGEFSLDEEQPEKPEKDNKAISRNQEQELNSEQEVSDTTEQQYEVPDSNTEDEYDDKTDDETDNTENSSGLEKGQQKLHGNQGKAETPRASDRNTDLKAEKRKAREDGEGSSSDDPPAADERNVDVKNPEVGKKQVFRPKKRKIMDD